MDTNCPLPPSLEKNGWSTLSIGDSCQKIEYYPDVNALLCYHVGNNTRSCNYLSVLEITTGQVLKTFHFSEQVDHVVSMLKQKKILVGAGKVLGLTKELGGCLYLENCLQLPASTTSQEVSIELTYDEAKILQPWFAGMQNYVGLTKSLKNSVNSVMEDIESSMEQLPDDSKLAESGSTQLTNLAKKVKWHSVKLKLPVEKFLELLESLYSFRFSKDRESFPGLSSSSSSGSDINLASMNTDYAMLPILFAILDRLASLHQAARQLFLRLEELVSKEPNSDGSHDVGVGGYVAGMCSEYARRLTFITWPHYSYKWAKPDSMAKAGFYHTKGAHNGKDGVQCFKCRINLVKWEASDEPWNEHEQHSPNCLFLKGESTHNVPIANTVAFSPAVRSCDDKKMSVVSCSNHPFLLSTSSVDGSVHVWNCCAVPKLYFNFSVDTGDELIANMFAPKITSGGGGATHGTTTNADHWGTSVSLPSFFMEEVTTDTNAISTLLNTQGGESTQSAKGKQSHTITIVDSSDTPTVTFPPEDSFQTGKQQAPVQVTSLALSGFGGNNPSPFGCLVVVGCKVWDPKNSSVADFWSNNGVNNETCLLVYKVDVTDMRAAKNALFQMHPDHTNLLVMDDKYSNFASEIASASSATHPMHSTITEEMMMFGELNDDGANGIQMEIELAQSPEMMDADMGGPADHLNYADFLANLNTANVYDAEALSSANEQSGAPNKLYNLLDARLMQAFPIQYGSTITHILLELHGNEPYLYVIASKETYSTVYVFVLEKVFNSFHFRGSMSTAQKHQNVLKMQCNQQFTQGVIKHALLLPVWSLNIGESPIFSTQQSNNVVSSVLLCVSETNDILLYKLPQLECVVLQKEEDKGLFGGHKIKSVTFDCGSDSLCVLTSEGSVHFIELRKLLGDQDEKDEQSVKSHLRMMEGVNEGDEVDASITGSASQLSVQFCGPSCSSTRSGGMSSTASGVSLPSKFEYLVDPQTGLTPELNTATLDWISQLSECVPLTPRYNTGIIPSGWVEVEQEQQQRKMSEHLPSSGGSSVNHTRTFRVNKESASGYTVIELTLPHAVVLGQVDVKIQLRKAASACNLTATLSAPAPELSQDTFASSNKKIIGPVALDLFTFGQQGTSINVSLTGPNLYLTKHRVIFLEIGTKEGYSSTHLHEVSITLRKMKRQPSVRTVAQLQTVVEDTQLVEKLLRAVTNPDSVQSVGDAKEFFMSQPTIRQTALTTLTWLLYTHATDCGSSLSSSLSADEQTQCQQYMAQFYSKCASSSLLRQSITVCLIQGDRSVAHLFARFLAVLLNSVNHTRTFRVNKESASGYTVIELTLPHAVVLGQVDVKIQLRKAASACNLTATLSAPAPELSQDTFASSNKKIIGPVALDLFTFGQQGTSINVSLTGPNLYLTKHRVIFLEIGTKEGYSSTHLHEVSITLRKMKRQPSVRTVAQLQTVVEDTQLVEKLLRAVTNPDSVQSVGDAKEFFMSQPTIRQTALTTLTWLLYTHATDCGSSLSSSLSADEQTQCQQYMAQFYSKCASSSLLRQSITVCLIQGDRSVAHLFARFLAVLLKFAGSCNQSEAKIFETSLKQTLLDLLPSSVTCKSHGGMHWFQLFFYNVVLAPDSKLALDAGLNKPGQQMSHVSRYSSENAFSVCLDLLDHLVSCSENLQDLYTKTLQTKFRLFCNPFEQQLLTFPMQTIIAHDTSHSNNRHPPPGVYHHSYGGGTHPPPPPGMGGKWYMPGGGGGGVPYIHEAGAPSGSQSLELVKNMIQVQSSRKSSGGNATDSSISANELSSQSFIDLFVPLNFVGFTLDNQLIGFLEAEPLRFSCVEASDGVKMQEVSSGNEIVGGHTQTLVDYEDTLNEPGMTPTLVQLINVAANVNQAASSGAAYNSMFAGGWSVNPPTGGKSSFGNQLQAQMAPSPGAFGPVGSLKQMSYADAMKTHGSMGSSVGQNRGGAPISDAIVGSIGGSLTHTPQPQYMLIDNLHPGVRKFVVLDFGRTIVLSDVFIGPCVDLASLTLDCWVKGEALDSMRVATSLDISTDALALTDIQPSLHCRYLKLTVSGKYGSASSAVSAHGHHSSHGQNKVLLPINTLYGHTVDCEYEAMPREAKIKNVQELQEKHLKTLAIVHDDLLCRYSLASNHLKSLISPHAAALSTPLASNSSISEQKRYVSEVCSNCRVLQRQLNVVTRVIERVKNYFSSSSSATPNISNTSEGDGLSADCNQTALSSASTTHVSHATRFTLLSMLQLAVNSPEEVPMLATDQAPVSGDNESQQTEAQPSDCAVSEEQCFHFMRQLCIRGVPNNGILALTLLHRVCHRQQWWAGFVASSFVKFFSESTNSEIQLHVVKVYITILHLAKQDEIIDDVILSFVNLLLCGTPSSSLSATPNSHPTDNSTTTGSVPIVPPVNANGNSMASGSWVGGVSMSGNCNWSQLSAILMIISQGMCERSTNSDVYSGSGGSIGSYGGSFKWDFFPSILNADFLRQGLATGNAADKSGAVKGQKQISRKTIGVGGTALTKSKKIMGLFAPKTTHNQGTSATGSGLQGSSQAHSNKSEKEKKPKQSSSSMDAPPKMFQTPINDVSLPPETTQELMRRLLCLLPELIRSQATDLVMLLCRVVSLLSSACRNQNDLKADVHSVDGSNGSVSGQRANTIRIVNLFPENLLSHILLNAFVLTTNQLITYAVQSLILDIMQAELGKPNADNQQKTRSAQSGSGCNSEGPFKAKSRAASSSSASSNPFVNLVDSNFPSSSSAFGSSINNVNLQYSDPLDQSSLHSSNLNLNKLLSGELSNASIDNQMEFIHEVLGNPPPPPYGTTGSIFGPTAHSYKKNSSQAQNQQKTSRENNVQSQRNGDCLDARLESGILHHSERWLNQLQSAYTASVYKNLACLNFNPPKKTILKSAESELHVNASQPAGPDITGTQNMDHSGQPTFEDTRKMLHGVFDELLSPRNLPYLDLKEVLLCWYHISNLKSDGESRNIIALSSDNIGQIFNKLTVENTSDSVVWSLLFQCLIALCATENNLNKSTNAKSDVSQTSSVLPQGIKIHPGSTSQSGKDNGNQKFESAPTVVIKNLINYPVLDTFLSGSWSPGGTRSEQCRGPGVTQVFGSFLDTLNKYNEDKYLMGQLLMKLLKSMCEFSGAVKQGYGPVDCQVELVNKMLDFSLLTHDPKIMCSLVNVICKLGYEYVSRYRSSVTMTANTAQNKNLQNLPNICLTVFGVGTISKDGTKLRAKTNSTCTVNSRENLLKQLFKLAQKLVKIQGAVSQFGTMGADRTVADCIVCDDQNSVISTLLVTLSACILPTFGSSEAMTSDSWTLKQLESFVQDFSSASSSSEKDDSLLENKTLGDFILQLLICLEMSTRERKVLHQRLVQSLNSSAGAFPLPTLSHPVLCFFMHLLRNIDEVKMFSSVGGVQVLVNKIVCDSETGPGFSFSFASQPLLTLQQLTKCFEVDSLDLQLQLNDTPKNIGPKAAITCSSDPQAQLPDVLLQENPPHKRARSAAWTYHFPADQSGGTEQASCSLTITLPTLSIVHYVEIKLQTPAMGISHNLPSSVSLEVFPSRDSVLDPPSCVTAPLIVSRASGGSSSCIQLRPHEPQLCGRLLLNFYPPPECSSIGLSHIAVYARPVLSDMTQPSNSTDHILTSLHAFKLIEYCMETQLDTLSKKQSSLSFAPNVSPPSDSELLGSLFSESFTAPLRDRLLSACLSLLTQSSAQLFFPCLKRTVLCLANLQLPEVAQNMSAVERDHVTSSEVSQSQTQAETVQHVVVIVLDSFVSSAQPLTAVYVDEVLDLLFSLCTKTATQQVLLNRISTLVSWLEANLFTISQCTRQSSSCIAHLVHAIASILWQVHAQYMYSTQANTNQSGTSSSTMPPVVSIQHFSNVCRHVLDGGLISENILTSTSSVLKTAFDWLLCSYVHMYPSFLKTLLRLLGCPDLRMSPDSSTSGPMSPPSPIPMFGANDDSKQQKSYLSKQWWATLSRNQLATLHHCLLDAKALDVFRNFAPVAEMFSLLIDLSLNDESSEISRNSDMNVKTLIRLLEFLTNMSENNPQAKRWLGLSEKTRFWSPLLTSLCYDRSRQQCLNLTDAALKFFETVVEDNTTNQRNLAEIVSQLISQKTDALNSFVKQLILNVFLKEERITVVVNSNQDKLLKWPSAGARSLGHPKFGIGHRVVFGRIDADSSIETLLTDILDPSQIPMDYLPVTMGIGGKGLGTGKDGKGGMGEAGGPKMKMKGSKMGGGSMAMYSPLSQKMSKIEQKKKTLEKMNIAFGPSGGVSKMPLAMLKHLAKFPNSSYWTAKVKSHTQGGQTSNSQQSVGHVQQAANKSADDYSRGGGKVWRCVHKTVGSDWLPNTLSFRQLTQCLKQMQSRDIEEGFVKLDLIGVSSDEFEEMEMAIAETLEAMMETNYGPQQQSSGQQQSTQQSTHLRPPQVFASVGGFTKLALRIPVLNADFVKLMCTNSKDANSGANVSSSGKTAVSGLGFPGSDKLDLSEWILIDQHTFGGSAPGADGAGIKGNSYNLIDVESSDEENYSSLDWADETGYMTPHPPGAGPGAVGNCAGGVAVVAPHCLALLGLTLQLPLYVEVLLREERKARFLLRILLGVSDVGDSTTSILSTPEAKNLSTLPLEALRSLFDQYPVNTELGLVIRQQCVDAEILDLLFGCLAVLTHRNPESADVKSYQFLFPPSLFGVGSASAKQTNQRDKYAAHMAQQLDPMGVGVGVGIGPSGSNVIGGNKHQSNQYWAKGTGFGTGSMQSGWNMEQSLLKKHFEEHNCQAILQVLSSFISGASKSSMENTSADSSSNSSIVSSFSVSSLSRVGSSVSGAMDYQNMNMDMYAQQHTVGSSGMSAVVNSGTAGSGSGAPTVSVTASGPVDSVLVDMSNFSCRLHDLICRSCLMEVLNTYLTNDSVLDMDRHVAVHQAVLDIIRAMVSHEETASELMGLMEEHKIVDNLESIRNRHSAYHAQLSKNLRKLTNTGSSSSKGATGADPAGAVDGDPEGVNKLGEELDYVYRLVQRAWTKYQQHRGSRRQNQVSDLEPGPSGSGGVDPNSNAAVQQDGTIVKTPREIYCDAMKPLQFLSFMLVKEGGGAGGKNISFAVPFHFVTEAKMASDSLNTKRAKRLAQESVSLSSALPLDYSSSVFIRYDEDRLDIMKVLMTGPADTPYSNGCFLFDIFFPPEYPHTPLLCNFTTTGNGTVRFNPNLYNDGKVCLSILNTWHGRPEEKWNAQTSNLLQVLVSIQSLILVSEPYFNEPGYERSRNTPAGQENSDEYSANIKQATVKWAMLNQLRNPPACFKEVIHTHFYLKRKEILKQVQDWLANMEALDIHKRYAKKVSSHVQSLRKSLNELRLELNKLKAPEGLADVSEDTSSTPSTSAVHTGESISIMDNKNNQETSSSRSQSPSSKAAHELLNSVLNSVFMSPAMQPGGSAGGVSSNLHHPSQNIMSLGTSETYSTDDLFLSENDLFGNQESGDLSVLLEETEPPLTTSNSTHENVPMDHSSMDEHELNE